MLKRNSQQKQDIYKRDILRDYALASAELAAQFDRFDESGAISFSVLRGIMGEVNSKGLLWQLKDTAHHLFSAPSGVTTAGRHLDWALGFLFHECMIILESSYQMQKYYPAAGQFVCHDQGPLSRLPGIDEMQDDLRRLAGETQNNLAATIGRIRRLTQAVNLFMCAYLAGEAHNRPLARLIHDREDMLRAAFGPLYEDLLAGIYGEQRERLYIEAAWSLMEGGHPARAKSAAQKALTHNPRSAEALEFLDKAAQVRQ